MQSIYPTLAASLYSYERQDGGCRAGGGLRTGVKRLDGDGGGVGVAKVGDRGGGRGRGSESGSAKGRGVGGVFRPGVVLSIGGVGELHNRSLYLIHSLIATHLLDSHLRLRKAAAATTTTPRSQASPKVFILEPPTTSGPETSLLNIYELLEARIQRDYGQDQNKTASRVSSVAGQNVDIDTLIDSVAIIPYFDLVGVSQGLSEISDSLRGRYQHQDADSHQETRQDFADAPDDDDIVIVLLRGLPETLATLATKTSLGTGAATSTGTGTSTGMSTAQPAALLTEITRQLRRIVQLSTTTLGHEVLVLVEIAIAVEEGGTGAGPVGSNALRLRSAFSSVDGRGLTLGLGSYSEVDGSGSTATGKAAVNARKRYAHVYDVLVGILETKLDSIVVVHDGFGITGTGGRAGGIGEQGKIQDERVSNKCIVEVLKDRTGDTMGLWSIWEGSG